MNYKQLYEDVMNDNLDDYQIFYKRELKLLFKHAAPFDKKGFNSKNKFVEKCLYLLESLKEEERSYIDDGFLVYISCLDTKSVDYIKALIKPESTCYLQCMSSFISEHRYWLYPNLKTDFLPLTKLNNVLYYINSNTCFDIRDNCILKLLIAYCYAHDDTYSLVYNYINDEDYYLEKLMNDGILLSKRTSMLNSLVLVTIYNNIDTLFQKNKIIIK